MNLASFLCQDVEASILLRVQSAFIVSTASRLFYCSIFVGRLLIYTALAKGVQNPFSYFILYITISYHSSSKQSKSRMLYLTVIEYLGFTEKKYLMNHGIRL